MTRSATDSAAREAVSDALLAIVPDAPIAELADDTDLREALELDSLDFLAFVEQLNTRTGMRFEEDDYSGLRTIAGCLRMLRRPAG
ncbi:acyl carrier protein [Actinokineospora xionganensis]|uniref:Acyl carrier protein n=1 Tax=Actinokineospora xionganensis TaxID=2684470 RepID=A0ABR7KZR8_9PSEU|nr:acyl carrier protein [Actinokineospora xionganensis]MBC6445869.1 acyl carrier protein [Actinokineospora xionganensis]